MPVRLYACEVICLWCYMPVRLYACEVWGVHLLGKLKNFIKSVAVVEKLHLKFCKWVLGVHSKASNAAVYAELGRTPLIVQVSTLVIKYWLRITNPIYKDSLVGKAASLCVQLNSLEVVFTNFVLELSNVKTLSEINPTLKEIEIIVKHVKENWLVIS